MNNFAERLNQAMVERQVSQKELAAATARESHLSVSIYQEGLFQDLKFRS